MKTFDLHTMEAAPYEERDTNVFYQAPEFKARIIELPPDGTMPECEMASSVVFIALDGEATVTVDHEDTQLKEGNCLITEPATLSMQTASGVRILGLQIAVHRD